MPKYPNDTIYLERLLAKTTKVGDCLVWVACKDKCGYGKFNYHGKMHLAHRVHFKLCNGFWPELTRHLCNNPSCVNSEHLKEGTQTENVQDAYPREINPYRHVTPRRIPFSSEQLDYGRKLRNEGASLYETARHFKCSKYFVRRYIDRLE